MRKKKIVIQTNSPTMKSGLAENGRALASYLYKTGKYDIVYYATQASAADPIHNLMPWKTYGAIPHDPHVHQQMNANMGLARDISYGSYYIDDIIKKEKPDIIFYSDDIWGYPLNIYADKPWSKKLSSIYHITVDSVPVLDQAFQQAQRTPFYFTWAKFAAEAMKKAGPKFNHVKYIYGAVDIKHFFPIKSDIKSQLRKKFGISDKTIIIGMVGRNQLRKEFPNALMALAEYKKENPGADVKLHFHTSFSEKGNGWDLEKLIGFYGLKKEDVLCTYVCKNCGDWSVEYYKGEDINCSSCGAEKSRITANLQFAVPNEEMSLLYGLWDAGINLHTSGGLEYNCVNTLLCGLPLACTNYASGEDFCEQPFVTAINFERRHEAGTSFMKASNSIKSIKNFIDKIYRMPLSKRQEIGIEGRKWAEKQFSIETIGAQWEKVFESCPFVDWEGFSFEPELKNPNWNPPANYQTMDEDEFLTLIYKEILGMDEPTDGSGRLSWKNQIKNGVTRDQIIFFFKKTAIEENNKNKKIDLWDVIDKNRLNKRALLLVKQSIGDCLIMTQLFESFHEMYPNHDLYIGTDPQYMQIFEGNPYVHKVLPYIEAFENELIMTGAGKKSEEAYFHVYFHPCIPTQRQLNYLSADKISLDLTK